MNWLSDHLAHRRVEIADQQEQVPEAALRARLAAQAPARPFVLAHGGQCPAVIAEIKFRSPSQGVLRSQNDVEAVAEGYHRAGASALSVLVDGAGFGGELAFLGRARAACPLPLLAKGFFLDPYDLLAVRVAGADAALLIARALSRRELVQMLKASRELGLAVLVELHDEADLVKIAGLELGLVGVNHRDLDTLRMDAGLSARLAPKLPVGPHRVAESGLGSGADLARMGALGYDAVLVGTAFMALSDPGAGLAELLEDCHACR